MLALSESGEELIGARSMSLLPPANTLGNMLRRTSNSMVRAWAISTTGASGADLIRSDRINSVPLREAFMRPSGEVASRHAVLYKGHYAATVRQPSSASIGDDNGDQLLTAHEILASDCVSPARVALMCCRGAGLHFTDEWGGIASALMVKGARELVAPSWPIIDSPCATALDDAIAIILQRPGHFSVHFAELIRGLLDDRKWRMPDSVQPHWWSGYYLLKG
jgi:hypothetical protein